MLSRPLWHFILFFLFLEKIIIVMKLFLLLNRKRFITTMRYCQNRNLKRHLNLSLTFEKKKNDRTKERLPQNLWSKALNVFENTVFKSKHYYHYYYFYNFPRYLIERTLSGYFTTIVVRSVCVCFQSNQVSTYFIIISIKVKNNQIEKTKEKLKDPSFFPFHSFVFP